jgi:hypothetical protein
MVLSPVRSCTTVSFHPARRASRARGRHLHVQLRSRQRRIVSDRRSRRRGVRVASHLHRRRHRTVAVDLRPLSPSTRINPETIGSAASTVSSRPTQSASVGVRRGFCRQHLGGLRGARMVCRIPLLDAQPSWQPYWLARPRAGCRHSFAPRGAGERRDGRNGGAAWTTPRHYQRMSALRWHLFGSISDRGSINLARVAAVGLGADHELRRRRRARWWRRRGCRSGAKRSRAGALCALWIYDRISWPRGCGDGTRLVWRCGQRVRLESRLSRDRDWFCCCGMGGTARTRITPLSARLRQPNPVSQ